MEPYFQYFCRHENHVTQVEVERYVIKPLIAVASTSNPHIYSKHVNFHLTRELASFINGNMGTWEHGNMGTWANFSRELGTKVDSGEQFGISFKGTVNKYIFWNKGDFRNFSKEHGNIDHLRVLCHMSQFVEKSEMKIIVRNI